MTAQIAEINTDDLKRYPGWKNAEDEIIKLVALKGYDFIISMEKLHDFIELEEPTTLEAYKKYQFEWLGSVENLKDSLLENHQICLMNLRGKGYMVCTPDDQVSKAYAKIMRKVGLGINKALATLVNVNQSLLSGEGSKIRLENLAKISFLKQTTNKKELKK